MAEVESQLGSAIGDALVKAFVVWDFIQKRHATLRRLEKSFIFCGKFLPETAQAADLLEFEHNPQKIDLQSALKECNKMRRRLMLERRKNGCNESGSYEARFKASTGEGS